MGGFYSTRLEQLIQAYLLAILPLTVVDPIQQSAALGLSI